MLSGVVCVSVVGAFVSVTVPTTSVVPATTGALTEVGVKLSTPTVSSGCPVTWALYFRPNLQNRVTLRLPDCHDLMHCVLRLSGK